jgi:putative Ca2+/H+ antiporter (TMEM165/GDT1 family)
VPIILGVLVATLANHAAAGGVGTLLSKVLNPSALNWAVVASFHPDGELDIGTR